MTISPSVMPTSADGSPASPERRGTGPAEPKLHYRPEIDGLRAFAVIPVILFHLKLAGFGAGSLGVDVFFVISGFLITSIVKREADAGTFSFRRFWARRIRRIMPAMIAVTVASLLFTAFFIYRPDQPTIYRQSEWSLLSAANIYFWKFVGDYWGPAAGNSPFLHMWSLAVEEQFYLFVPPAIWLIYKIAPRHLLAVVLAVLALSLATFVYAAPRTPSAAFYLLPSRAWELAAGCALAVVGSRAGGRGRAALGLLGLGLIVASYFTFPRLATTTLGLTPFSLGAMQAVLGATLVIAFARSGPAFALLANPASTYVGRISYSLYLWHWPVIVFPSYLDRHPPLWASLALMTALGVLSYYLVETPTRHAKRIVPLTLATLAATTGIAMLLTIAPPRHYDTSAFERPTITIRHYDAHPTPPPVDRAWETVEMLPAQLGSTAFVDGGLRTGAGDPQVVMLGDSHATFWAPVVQATTDRLNVPASFWMMDGVNPFFSVPPVRQKPGYHFSSDELLKYDEARVRLIKQWQPKLVVVAARWSNNELADVMPFVDYVSANAGQVLLIEQPPELPIGNRNVLEFLVYKGVEPNGRSFFYAIADADRDRRGREMLRALAASHANVRVVSTADVYLRGDLTRVLDGRRVVYMDDDHLTSYGASLAGPRIDRAISDALGRTE